MAQTVAFTGRYARYKKSTDTVLDWLARTASTCCDIASIVASLQTADNRRKIAKGSTVITLRTAELVRLAQAIADADPSIPTPLTILETTRDVIRLRQDVAADYAMDSMRRHSTLTESDHGHKHFIAVLQQVHDILKPSASTGAAPAPPAKSNKRKKKSVATTEDTTNAFARLQVEEPQAVIHVGPSKAFPGQAPADDYTRTTFKLDKKEENANIALICHLQDLHDVRILVKEAWISFSRGEVSLVYASMVTEVAFGLLRCADDQFTTLNPKLAEYRHVLDALGVRCAKSDHDRGIMFVMSNDETAPLNEGVAGLDLSELLCPQAFFLLQDHINHQMDLSTASQKQEFAAHRATINLWSETHPFAKVLLKNPLGTMIKCGAELRLNEMIAGLQRGFKEGKIWTWSTVACQTYMDISDVLEGSESIGVGYLKAALQDCLDLEAPSKAFFEGLSRRTPAGDSWPEWMSGVAEDARKALRQIDMPKDTYFSAARGTAGFTEQKKDFQKTVNRWTSGLESVLPTLAGGSTFMLKEALLSTGCCNANHPSLPLHSMAYLYRAGRRLGIIPCDWPDMEFMIASQASVGPLVPKLAADCQLDRYLEAFKVATGLRPDIDGHFNRETVVDVYGKGVPIRVGAEFCAKVVESITAQKASSVQTSMGKIVEIILHDKAHTNKHNKTLGKQINRNDTASNQRESFSPVELPTVFQTSFRRDEPILNFDYHGFMLHCHQLCGEVADAIISSNTFVFDDGLVTSLDVEMGTERLNERPHDVALGALLQLQSDLADPEVLKQSFWPSIASVMEKTIKNDGKRFMKAANDQSSGHIPKSLRRSIGKKHADWLKSNASRALLLKPAGTKVAFTGKLVTLSHPALTLAKLNQVGSGDGHGTVVPGFMVSDGAGGHFDQHVMVMW
ncbi:hypothetical protein CLAFUW4_12295 [Fulvia fulva]|uniref:DUF6604 domain-containing protein n=1 Tax=Passalora fulva TaxID=5499 RepID=A0A9Q8PEM8_PASFU|nr:uncharacterized protein CLAFUR5_11325 [Fulvia fulva]KAK4618926.1 hypothetical protein CLAFUR0_12311 [Fulvia fulva]UJO21049.1 hypothetical protein CLAFUR5_11325 [Fulvia fulva]WPV18429.1 hypothetical protein CLAFUW4_12295 [Fulvia fulva]